MGGQVKKAGRGIIDTRLAFQGNTMSRLNWSSCIVLVGYLLLWGISALPIDEQVTDKNQVVQADVVLADSKKQTEVAKKSEEPAKVEQKPDPEPVVIDTKAQNTVVQQIELSDCERLALEIQKYDWDANVMLAIAKAESSCRANAVGDKSITFWQNGREYGYSVGMFQIRMLPGREHCETFDIAENVKCAYDIYSSSVRAGFSGYRPWSVWLNGMYKKYL